MTALTVESAVEQTPHMETIQVVMEAALLKAADRAARRLKLNRSAFIREAVRSHLRLQNIIHWIKSIAIDQASAGAAAGLRRDLAVGHYKPINSNRFLNDCHEFIFHLSPQGSTSLDRLALGVPYQDQSNIGRWRAAADGVRCRGNTWFIPYETIQSRDRDRPHPASFPSRLPEQCLRLHGLKRIERVMDPFNGLGSTAVACARLGVPDFIGVDIDKTYLDAAAERVRNLGKPRMAKAELREEKRVAAVRAGKAGEAGRAG